MGDKEETTTKDAKSSTAKEASSESSSDTKKEVRSTSTKTGSTKGASKEGKAEATKKSAFTEGETKLLRAIRNELGTTKRFYNPVALGYWLKKNGFPEDFIKAAIEEIGN